MFGPCLQPPATVAHVLERPASVRTHEGQGKSLNLRIRTMRWCASFQGSHASAPAGQRLGDSAREAFPGSERQLAKLESGTNSAAHPAYFTFTPSVALTACKSGLMYRKLEPRRSRRVSPHMSIGTGERQAASKACRELS